MTVYFIGAGPGDPELLTLKAARLISNCPVCLYAGSLVPAEVVAGAPDGALARVHSGDPSLYGAIAEQIRLLKRDDIAYQIVPGVPAYTAAAAALGQELTVPELAQSIVLTRMSMKSTGMPAGESLENFARTGSTLAIHLGIRALREIERILIPHYGAQCPVAVVYRVGWPDEMVLRGTLSDIRAQVRDAKITRTALILVGPALAAGGGFPDSALYDPARPHVLRPRVKT